MKYMSKTWYNKMLKMEIMPPYLEIDENTKYCSEEQFNELYLKRKQQQFKKYGIYDFDTNFNNTMNKLKEYYPNEILKDISDIRVLALGYVTNNVYNKITKFCNNNKNFVNKAIEDYNREFKKQFNNLLPDFAKEDYHDSIIIDIKYNNNDLKIKLDSKNSFTNVKEIIFKNYETIKNYIEIQQLKDSTWLYEEIYKTTKGYELHILLLKKEVLDLIIKCTDIEIIK